MGNEPAAILLSFLNILTDELQIEELASITEALNLIPILIQLIKSGELAFVFDPLDEKFSNAIKYIKNTLGNNFVEQLDAECADKGDKFEIAKMLLAFIYALRLLQEEKFSQYSNRLSVVDNNQMANIVSVLDSYDRFSPLPFSDVLNNVALSASLPTVIRTSLTPKSKENNKENNLQFSHHKQIQSPGFNKTINTFQSSGNIGSSKKSATYRLKTPSSIIKERNYLLALESSPVNKVLSSPRGEEVIRIQALKEELKLLKEFLDQLGQEKDRLDELCRTKEAEITLLKEDNESKRIKIARFALQIDRISTMEEDILKLEEEKSKFEKILREEKNKTASLEVRLAEVKFERDETLQKLQLHRADFEHLKGEYDKALKREKCTDEMMDQIRTKLAECEHEHGIEINVLNAQLREMEGAIEEERKASRLRVGQKESQMQDQIHLVQQIKEHSEEQVEQMRREYIMEQKEMEAENYQLKQKNQQLSADYDILFKQYKQIAAEAIHAQRPLSRQHEFSQNVTSIVGIDDRMIELEFIPLYQKEMTGAGEIKEFEGAYECGEAIIY